MKIILTLTVLASLLLLASANYKTQYCINREFVGNPENRRPHLHCGSNFVTLSLGNAKKRLTHNGQIKCPLVKQVLIDIDSGLLLPAKYTSEAVRVPIKEVLDDIRNGECSELDQLLRILMN